jgi:RimJ/RimL family protein N-acetyltransferase
MRKNRFDQPIGEELERWQPAPWPSRTPIEGRYCRVEPLKTAQHLDDLAQAFAEDREGEIWTYIPGGPFDTKADLKSWLDQVASSDDPFFYAILDAGSDQAVGIASHCSIRPEVGVIEVGYIVYSPRLQKTAAATEAMFLMMQRAFADLGYRRYEWKCDALNAPSRRAALRLGFTYEGTFRPATIYKHRNRDTAWFSIIDKEWPAIEKGYLRWLDPANFDNEGRQRDRLQRLIDRARKPLLDAE